MLQRFQLFWLPSLWNVPRYNWCSEGCLQLEAMWNNSSLLPSSFHGWPRFFFSSLEICEKQTGHLTWYQPKLHEVADGSGLNVDFDPLYRGSLFSGSPVQRTRGSRYKPRWERFHLDVRKEFFAVRTVSHWNNLPRDTASPQLQVFKMWLDRVPDNLIWAPFPRKVGPDDPSRSFLTWAVLWLWF